MRYLRLEDPVHLSERVILVPQPLIPALALMDGTRDLRGLQSALLLRYRRTISVEHLSSLVSALDEAYLLENKRFEQARKTALQAFRSAGLRPAALAGLSYPQSAQDLAALFDGYLKDAGVQDNGKQGYPLRGLLSPHIDYQRGHRVYAQTWAAAARAVQEADLAVIFGTDHHSEGFPFSLTRQPYATPFGTMRIPTKLLDSLVGILGEEQSFAGELHHRQEHSIELAANWLQYIRGARPLEMLPILVGPLESLAEKNQPLSSIGALNEFIANIQAETRRRRVLVIAAGDLSHVGPAFGGQPADLGRRIAFKDDDDRLLEWIRSGQAEGFYYENLHSCSNNNVCGSAPIYLTLRILGQTSGVPLGYEVCPADAESTSFVSIAGYGLL